MSQLSHCFRKVFQLRENDIKINDPFEGGYIVQKYGNNPVPWIHVELNKKLYLKEPWFNEKKLTIDMERIKSLNRMFKDTLIMFMDMIENL